MVTNKLNLVRRSWLEAQQLFVAERKQLSGDRRKTQLFAGRESERSVIGQRDVNGQRLKGRPPQSNVDRCRAQVFAFVGNSCARWRALDAKLVTAAQEATQRETVDKSTNHMGAREKGMVYI